jgi:hypothetical protein
MLTADHPPGGFVDSVSHSFCKLLVALGEQSTSYFATNIASRTTVSPSGLTKSYLVQAYLRTLLSYTGLPGYAGLDEDESEMTLAFWYLFQESLWTADYHPDFDEDGTGSSGLEGEQATVTQALYRELVQILRRKVVWPSDRSWPRGRYLLPRPYFLLPSTSRPVREIPSVCSSRLDLDSWGADLIKGTDVTSAIR